VCNCGQLMRGRVKRGKGRSLGLHGASGREGVAHRGGGGVSAGSGWRREGERDPRPVGWLGMLAARWVGPKVTGLKGRTGRRAAGPTEPELKRNSF
jgi:hypothetical protein